MFKNNILLFGIHKTQMQQLILCLPNCRFLICHHTLQLQKQIKTQKISLLVMSAFDGHQTNIAICDRLCKQYNKLPVIVVGGVEDTELEMSFYCAGAVDYLCGDMNIKILSRKIESTLRVLKADEHCNQSEDIIIGDYRFNIDRKILVDHKGTQYKLTQSESFALDLLAQRQNQVVSRDELYWWVYDRPYDGMDRTIDVLMSKLRKKLHTQKTNKPLIKTVNRGGYMLNVPCC
ncbi:winged helix-turn-helix domain-containing protein [Cysteiniphilum sp. 6C5]|uniref:winged helix-turn-helix domain-containing protein n=1 Tax=unclassified Cysteiniphilum TaxID=2610889 RepID=UPI003F875030